MAKFLGFLFGMMMLADGAMGAYEPRMGFRLWEQIKGYFPESVDEVMTDYSKLPDRSIRFLAYWEIAMALLLLWLSGGREAEEE